MKNLKKTDTKSGKTYFYNFFAYHILKKNFFLCVKMKYSAWLDLHLRREVLKIHVNIGKSFPVEKL